MEEKMFWVYLLKCADKSYYTGHTDNLENRLAQHHNKVYLTCYTATRLPVQLMFSQAFNSREEALASERQIKGWSRKKKEALVSGDWEKLSLYSKRKAPT
jgi:putative endonuclease